MPKRKDDAPPTLEEMEAKYLAALKQTDPARAVKFEKFTRTLQQQREAAVAKLDSYRGTVIPIEEMVKSLADARWKKE